MELARAAECGNMVAGCEAQPIEIIEFQGSTRLAFADGEPVSDRRQPGQGSARRWARIASVLAMASVTLACNEPHFLIPSPTLRGITIPLPPPSIAEEGFVTIDVEGAIPLGFEGPGTKAFLYEKGTSRGYFVYADEQTFTIYDVLVDVGDNCLESWFVDGVDEAESTVVNYKAVLAEGEACMEPSCSEPDQLGACLCLEKWTTGC
jgi:hypothetical protein